MTLENLKQNQLLKFNSLWPDIDLVGVVEMSTDHNFLIFHFFEIGNTEKVGYSTKVRSFYQTVPTQKNLYVLIAALKYFLQSPIEKESIRP